MIEFASNGDQAEGYLATPAHDARHRVSSCSRSGGASFPRSPAACDRLAAEGFVALAPDLYHGDDRRAHRDGQGRGAHERACRPSAPRGTWVRRWTICSPTRSVAGDSVGVVGFCMGGLLTLVVAAQQGDKIGAAVPYYGAPLGDSAPDWSGLTAPVLGHYAEDDGFFPSDACLDARRGRSTTPGRTSTFVVYPGMGHAFANEENPLGNYDRDVAAQAWARTIDFLHSKLG